MHRMNEAWWCNTISVPGEQIPRLSIMEKSYRGIIVVNSAGERFSSESQSYMAFQQKMFEKHTEENPCNPSWQRFDGNFGASYFVGPLYNSEFLPDSAVPKRYEEEFFAKAETTSELARKISVDVAGMEGTVCKMNNYARKGKDPSCRRDESS